MSPWNASPFKVREVEVVGGGRRGRRLVRYERALEILEYRALPSAMAGEAAVEDAPTLQDLALASLVDVPVSADMHASGVLAELFGIQPPFSMLVPLPQFLTPAGTSTVSTDVTGPITFTNFQVDSERLNQLANNIALPDGGTPYVSPYLHAITIQTASTLDLVHFVFEPLTLELPGADVVLSHIDMTMSFPDVPGSPLFLGDGGASAISAVSRGIDLFASGLGAVLKRVDEIAGAIALSLDSSAALRGLTSGAAETVPVARYQLPPTFIDDPTITISMASGANVDVTARTGAANLLGNLLAKALFLQNSGYANLERLFAQYLSNLLLRTPLQFQKEIFYGFPFAIPLEKPYVYEARIGSFELPGTTAQPSMDYETVLSVYVGPRSARVLITVVDQSSVTANDRRGQAPSGGQVPPKSRAGVDGSAGSTAGAAGGARIQPRKDPRGEKGPQVAQKQDDDHRPLPQLLMDASRVHRRPRYGHEEYTGSAGITSGPFGGARIQPKKKHPWAEDRNEPGQEHGQWDEDPLPQVLPDIGLRDRSTPRSESAGDTGELAWRRVPAPRQGLWGQGLTVQILLMFTALLEGDYSETFTA